MATMNEVFNKLNNLLAASDLSNVTSESTGFSEIPDGYYLSEVEKAELKESNKSKEPMIAFQFSIVEDGYDIAIDDVGTITKTPIQKTKKRKLFLYYVLKDESSVRRFTADMLKFEGNNAGESLLPKEAFTTAETLVDALDCLVGLRLYIHTSTSEKDDGTKSTWHNLVSWKRADALELPM